MVAAGDEAAQADPTVVPFHPAVRVNARFPPSTGLCPVLPRPITGPGSARALDAISLTDRAWMASPPMPRSADSLRARTCIARCAEDRSLRTGYERALVPLFIKVHGKQILSPRAFLKSQK